MNESALKILPQSYTEFHGGKSKNLIKTPWYSKQSGVAGLQYSVVFIFLR
jgi:hypothetical protein